MDTSSKITLKSWWKVLQIDIKLYYYLCNAGLAVSLLFLISAECIFRLYGFGNAQYLYSISGNATPRKISSTVSMGLEPMSLVMGYLGYLKTISY